MTLEAKTKALKARALKAKGMNFCPRGSSRPRPVLEDYNADKDECLFNTFLNMSVATRGIYREFAAVAQ